MPTTVAQRQQSRQQRVPAAPPDAPTCASWLVFTQAFSARPASDAPGRRQASISLRLPSGSYRCLPSAHVLITRRGRKSKSVSVIICVRNSSLRTQLASFRLLRLGVHYFALTTDRNGKYVLRRCGWYTCRRLRARLSQIPAAPHSAVDRPQVHWKMIIKCTYVVRNEPSWGADACVFCTLAFFKLTTPQELAAAPYWPIFCLNNAHRR